MAWPHFCERFRKRTTVVSENRQPDRYQGTEKAGGKEAQPCSCRYVQRRWKPLMHTGDRDQGVIHPECAMLYRTCEGRQGRAWRLQPSSPRGPIYQG